MTTVREQLRFDFHNNIRPIFVKEYCEVCGHKEELHLHHSSKRFVECMDNVKSYVDFNPEEDISNIDSETLELIRNIMLGMQLRITYITLCKSCHIEEHKKDKNGNDVLLEGLRRKRNMESVIFESYINNELLDIFKNSIGIKLNPKDNIIKETFCDNRFRMRTQGINSINNFLKNRKIPYRITSKTGKKKVDGEFESYRYWEISQQYNFN